MPFAAGGGTDLIARVLVERLAETMRQRFVIINRPGASTNIGTAAVANAPADGYTLLLTSISFAANPSLYRKLSYAQSDFAPVALICQFAEHSGGHAIAAGQFRARIHRASEGASGRTELRLLWRGQRAASRRRAFAGHHRHENAAHPLWRRQPGDHGGAARRSADAARRQPRGAAADPERRPEAARHRGGDARRRAARRPDVPRAGHRLSHRHVVRAARAGENAARDRRHAQPRDRGRAAQRAVRARIAEQGADVVGGSPEDFAKFLREETERLSAVIRRANIQLD